MDLIDRQAAIDAVLDRMNIEKYGRNAKPEEIRWTLEKLPSAQPERKRGKWIRTRGSWCTPGGDPVWECSECGKGVHIYGVDKIISNIEWRSYGRDVADGQWVSCPNCGAKMEVDDERPD